MVVGASITVNNSRNEGNIDSGGQSEDTKVLTQILAELKKQNKQSMVANRKQESGFGGAGKAGTIATILEVLGLGVGSATVAAVSGIAGSTDPRQGRAGRNFSYARTTTEGGDEGVAKLDRETGEVLEIMSLEKARRNGIVDNLGNIEEELVNQDAEAKSVLAKMIKVGKAYIITENFIKETNDAHEEIIGVTGEQLKFAKRARDAQKAIAEQLERKAGIKGDDSDGIKPDVNRTVDVIFGGNNPIPNLGDQALANIFDAVKQDDNAAGPGFTDLLFGRR